MHAIAAKGDAGKTGTLGRLLIYRPTEWLRSLLASVEGRAARAEEWAQRARLLLEPHGVTTAADMANTGKEIRSHAAPTLEEV